MMTEKLKAFYAGKKVLVTGGAGFIGSHLTEALVGLEARVTVLDNFSTGSINNLKSVFPFVSIQCADITSEYATMKALENQTIVFHLAACSSVPVSIENPEFCYLVNVTGTENILAACLKNGINNVVFASSSAVYGENNNQNTEDSPLIPTNPYASSKILGERLCKEFAIKNNKAITCLRYFNVFGERQSVTSDFSGVIAKFTYQLKNNLPITIYGDGNQTRDFVPVEEIVKANLIFGCNTTNRGDTFNIASGKSITLLELIEQIRTSLDLTEIKTIFAPERDGDIRNSGALCTKYQQALEQFNATQL